MNRLKWVFSEVLVYYFQVQKHVSNCWGRNWVAFVSESFPPTSHLKKLNRSTTRPVNAA